MKTFILCFVLLLKFKTVIALPTYTLKAKNFTLIAPNSITFDIMITHTNSEVLEYAGGQYFFNFNNAIANGGTLSYAFAQGETALDSSNFPANMRPRGPTISGTMLRLAANSLPGAGNGTILPQDFEWKVCKMRLATTAVSFAQVNLDLQWRNGPNNPFTKINAYIGTTNTEITTTNTHTIENLLLVSVNIKLAIEGLFDSGNNKLLRKETVRVYLRNINSPFQILDSAQALIDSVSLTGNFNFTHLTPDFYYIVIKHKNSLETWSKSGGENLTAGNNFYDFTTSTSQAFGNNLVLIGNTYCIYSGNVNGDNIIDVDDLVQTDNDLFNYSPGSFVTNLNGDDIVDIDDLAIADKNAKNLVLVEWPGLTTEMRKQLLRSKIRAGGR